MGESFPMNGGDGAYSYTKNSQVQKEGSESVKGMIQEAVIEKLEAAIMSSSTVVIADLGCSTGPNTFFTVQSLIEAVQNKWSLQSQNIEFQVYFNDHTANDFNTLFASLPSHRQYHAAGVPGSFHGRLFPRGSISVAHSSYALQWLSKQPQGVLNEGRIHCIGAPTDVVGPFSDQFERDVGGFMSARAEEIVRGGLLLLLMPGTADGVSLSELRVNFDFLGDSLMELANEGVVEKSAVEAFNLPLYFPTVGEMRKLVEKNGCFSVERMEVRNMRSEVVKGVSDSDAVGQIMQLRAGLEGVFTAHFGTSVVDKMFANTLAKAQQLSHCLESEADFHDSTHLFFVLKRK